MTTSQDIVAFDFDGTLTRRDTLFEFIKFTHGRTRLLSGLIVCSPVLIAFKLKLISNHRAKQYLFSHFFKGMSYRRFQDLGARFRYKIAQFLRADTMEKLHENVAAGKRIYVISASIYEWVAPWCIEAGINNVLATRAEIRNGRLTGKFSTPNCYGTEKVSRLLEVEPHRESYHLTAYGDCHGDDALLAFADTPIRV